MNSLETDEVEQSKPHKWETQILVGEPEFLEMNKNGINFDR